MNMPRIEVVQVTEGNNTVRGKRNPKTPFSLEVRPWQIRPCFIHPVLPGESLANLMIMSRCVSDPIVNPLIGWWLQYHFYYVKLTDLPDRDALIEMQLNSAYDPTPLKSAANLPYFHNGGINYVKKCLDCVVEWYWRDEDELANQTLDTFPLAKVGQEGWWDSARKASAVVPSGDAVDENLLPGENPVIPDGVPAGFTNHYSQWKNMRALRLTDKSFEDYLRTFGVSIPKDQDEELHQPEEIRFFKEFTYPSNTVNPADGTPSSALSWSVAERADKTRYFAEPGFLFGVQVVKPKVYMGKVTGTLTSYMDSAYNWLPALMQDQPYAGLKEFLPASGPAPQAYGENYWVDIKDLLLYGEQFVSNTAAHNAVDLPDINLISKYATGANADAMFKVGANNKIRSDGVIDCQILSRYFEDTSL